MTITPSDLAVGQVWVPKRGTKKRHILSLDPLRYTQGGREQRCVTCELLVVFLNDDECTLSCETPVPPPIPHPSALGDLYAACVAAIDRLDRDSHPDFEPHCSCVEDGNGMCWDCTRDSLRSAIRKAGGVA